MHLNLSTAALAACMLLSPADRGRPVPPSDAGPPQVQQFGVAVAFAGRDLLVGRKGASARQQAANGGVHVFRADGSGAWREIAVVAPKDLAPEDEFGASLAVDGSVLAVGAPGAASGRGAVYLFTRGKTGAWTEQAKLTAAPTDSINRLGEVLALGDGILVAATPSYPRGYARGRVVVFRPGANARWREEGLLQPPDTLQRYQFGQAVAVAGGQVVVGIPGAEGQGKVVLYRHASGGWVADTALTVDRTPAAKAFGTSLLVEGNNLWVGSPDSIGAVHRFRRDTAGRWGHLEEIRAPAALTPKWFGSALGRDGRDLVVGAPSTGNVNGAIYVLRQDSAAGTWSAVAQWPITGAQRGLGGGKELAVGGGVIATGIAMMDGGEGAAVLFRRGPADGPWREAATLVDTAWNFARQALTGRVLPCVAGRVKVFACEHVDLLSFLPLSAIGGGKLGDHIDMLMGWGDLLSGVWGWTDSATGREFAIVGREHGTSFIEVTDPINPQYLGNLPFHQGAEPSIWRDMKVYQHYAFIVSDAAGPHGLQIFDLTQLRAVKQAPAEFQETAHYAGFHSAHTVAVNTTSGFLYPVGIGSGGETCGGGLHMLDIRTPTAPAFTGCYTEPETGGGYIHETTCVTYHGPDAPYKGHEICLNASAYALGIADVTDKQRPKTISIAKYPNIAYAHQAWFSEDHRYVFLNDEGDEGAMTIPRTRTIVFDLNDLDDPVVATEYFATTSATDHNLYIRGHLMYQSNYQAGLRVLDIADPTKPKEIGYFDTTPSGMRRLGAWTNYPYFKNGVIAVTSIGEGLFLLRLRQK